MKAAFEHRLARVRAIYLGGLLLAAGLRLAAFALAALLACTLLDALFGFGESVRLWMGILLLLGAAAFAGYHLATILSQSRRAIACWVDGLLPTRRRPVLSALELAEAPPPAESSAFGSYLVETALEQGRQAVDRLSARQLLPRAQLRRDALRLAAAAGVWMLLGLAWPVPLRTHALRILAPTRDVPPWSRLAFAVVPERPRAIYGDSLEIAATVSGPLGRAPVLFEMRVNGHVYRSAGFREATNRFVHRLERVVQPLQFCVRAGRARSRWYPLDVLYQPRIASAKVVLTPPAYAGLPPREFYLGGQKLAGLRGSRVALDVAANRPLRRGFIQLAHSDGTESRIDGAATGDHSIHFEWTLESDAVAALRVEDPLGTPNAGTHEFTQELLPDEPPVATLLEPPRYSLATPDSRIPIEAAAEDALGLRSFALVRNLAGYRDRALPLGIAAGARAAQAEEALDLRALGAQPGDVVELYAETADTNPDLLGTSMSDISRIDVISTAEYAEILRLRTAVEEFGERYRLISRQLGELRDALEDLAARKNDAPETRESAARKALDAWKALDASYRQVAADFAIYDMEKQLPQTLDAIRERSEPFAERLGRLPESLPESTEIAAQWLASIGEAGAELDRQAEDAALADQLRQVALAALELQQIVDRQAALVRALDRYAANLRATPAALLADFAEDQADVAAALEAWLADTGKLADDLPSGQAELAEEMRAVLGAVRAGKADVFMDQAADAARNENAPDAYRYAQAALHALRSACGQCEKSGNSFAGMCRNPGQGFRVKPGICSTLSQLCQALARQFGGQSGQSGLGFGGGGSFGGDSSDGYWTDGSSLLDVPIHGPPRSALRSPAGRGRGHGGSGNGRSASVQATESIERQSAESTAVRAVSLDEIPERYREPARIFYGIDETPEGPPRHE
ncbi:MAG: hypothetical protein AB7V22_00955 [Kiritimatiellia bacterium]